MTCSPFYAECFPQQSTVQIRTKPFCVSTLHPKGGVCFPHKNGQSVFPLNAQGVFLVCVCVCPRVSVFSLTSGFLCAARRRIVLIKVSKKGVFVTAII